MAKSKGKSGKSESWEIFTGKATRPTDRLMEVNPPPPPWRALAASQPLSPPSRMTAPFLEAEEDRAKPFRTSAVHQHSRALQVAWAAKPRRKNEMAFK